MAKSKLAVSNALRLIAQTRPDTVVPGEGNDEGEVFTILPSAQAGEAITRLAEARTAQELVDEGLPLKKVLGSALDWDGPKFTRATKGLVKVLGSEMMEKYPPSIEMVSFLALLAPLLEPERLINVAAVAAETDLAYGPIRYFAGPSGQFSALVSHYSTEIIERLALSLWEQAHDGQWWNHTTGDAARQRAANRRANIDVEQVKTELQAMLEAHETPTADLLIRAIDARCLTYSRDCAAALERMTEPETLDRRHIVESLRTIDDGDIAALATSLNWLRPVERPASPITTMIALAYTTNGGPHELSVEDFPEDPIEWAEMYPAASRKRFPYPQEVMELHKQRMPGLIGSDIALLYNPQVLQANGNHMGNCTFSYCNRCIDGSTFIIHTTYQDTEYNLSASRQGGRWVSGEVNSRFNHGNVPEAVRRSWTQLLGRLP